MGAYMTSAVLRGRRGLTLVEVVVALTVLLLALPLMLSLFSLGARTFGAGEVQSNLQQNTRLIADFISGQMRFAHEVQILGEDFEFHPECSHIYVREGSVVYRPPGPGDEQVLFEDISSDVTFSLVFADSEGGEDVLFFGITGEQQGAEYSITTEVLLLNASGITLDPEGDMEDEVGVGVRYVSPAPPPPMIRNVLLTHPGTGERTQGHVEGEQTQVRVAVSTYGVDNGTDVTLLAFEGDRTEPGVQDVTISPGTVDAEGHYVGQTSIFSDAAEFLVTFHQEVPPGTYKMQVRVDGIDEPLTRAYAVMPWGGLEVVTVEHITGAEDDLVFALRLLGWKLTPEYVITVGDWSRIESWTETGFLSAEDFSVWCDVPEVELAHSYEYDVHRDEMILALSSEQTLPEDLVVTVRIGGQQWQGLDDPDVSDVSVLRAHRSDTGMDCEFEIFRGG